MQPKPRDLRSWPVQVPRFDAQNLEASSPSGKQPAVPFRSQKETGEKLEDVREWQPSVVRWETGRGEAGPGNQEEKRGIGGEDHQALKRGKNIILYIMLTQDVCGLCSLRWTSRDARK